MRLCCAVNTLTFIVVNNIWYELKRQSTMKFNRFSVTDALVELTSMLVVASIVVAESTTNSSQSVLCASDFEHLETHVGDNTSIELKDATALHLPTGQFRHLQRELFETPKFSQPPPIQIVRQDKSSVQFMILRKIEPKRLSKFNMPKAIEEECAATDFTLPSTHKEIQKKSREAWRFGEKRVMGNTEHCALCMLEFLERAKYLLRNVWRGLLPL